MTDTHIVNVTFKPKPEHAAAFEDVMQSVKKDLPTAAGCESVRVMRHSGANPIYTLVEDWASKELHSAHIEGVVASGAWASLEEMLAEPPITIVLQNI